MTEPVLRQDVSQGRVHLTLNRPQVKNAFNEELIAAIDGAIRRYSVDDNVRAIVLTGAGEAFSAGADLDMMRRAGAGPVPANREAAGGLAAMLKAIYDCPKPVVALVNGLAMGGGVGLVAACDIVIAAEEAFFALSEARLGLIPAVISPYVIRAIGERQARRYFLTAERFDAETARRIGLVHMVAMHAQLGATLEGLLKNLSACGPIAQREAKDLIRAVAGAPIGDALIADTAARIARLRASPEGREGVAAFLEKRKPTWIR